MYRDDVERCSHGGVTGAKASPSVWATAMRETHSMEPVSSGSVRAAQKRLTRNRLLDSAVTVFAEKPFVDVTITDIAQAAGVTRVTVYAHFPGKGEIVQSLAERVYETMAEVYADLAAVPRWNRTEIRAWLDMAVEQWRTMSRTLWVVQMAGAAAASQVAGQSDRSRNRFVGEHDRFATMLTEKPRQWRDVSPEEARQRALMAVLQVEAFLTAWIAAELPLTTPDPLDLLADALCHLLAPALKE